MANLWKYFNIGRYAPIVFSPEYPLPNRINFGGEGGGENRFFYGSLSNPPIHNFDDYLTKFKSQFSKVEYFENWVQEVKNSISQIREDADSNLEDSILHYREFRSKNHTNKCPRNHNRIAILGSKYFKGFLHKASKEEVDLTMPFYDVMYANESRLLYLPFDKAHKNLNLRKIQLLKTAFSKFQGSGDAFMSTGDTFSEYLRTVDMSVFNVQKNQSKNPLSILLDDAQCIYEKNKNLIEDLCGNSFSKNLNSQFQSLIDVKNYNIHGRGYFLHNIFASTLFQPVANKKDSSRAVEFVDDAPKSITYFKR